jgi:large subunit ribosomal protein L10
MVTLEKENVVDDLRQRLRGTNFTVMSDFRGLRVGEMADLRRRVRAAEGELHIAKNSLLRIAAESEGFKDLRDLLLGPTAVAYAHGDEAALAKALIDYSADSPELVIKGGLLDKKYLEADQIQQLAALPPREVLVAQVVGGMQSPIYGLVGVLSATIGSFVRVLNARSEQLSAAG